MNTQNRPIECKGQPIEVVLEPVLAVIVSAGVSFIEFEPSSPNCDTVQEDPLLMTVLWQSLCILSIRVEYESLAVQQ